LRGNDLPGAIAACMRGTLFESDWLQLDLSLDGTLPARSKDNPARRGWRLCRFANHDEAVQTLCALPGRGFHAPAIA
jgi:hypothetical protein